MAVENKDVFRELQEHLDKMPIGYPATKSGVEIRVLKHLFTPEQAQLALNLKFQPAPLDKIYRKVKKSGISIEELEQKFDDMYFKGLIHRGSRKEGKKEVKYYANAFLVIGMFEFQLGRLTKEFLEDFHEYTKEAFWEDTWKKPGIPQLRTIPLGQTIEHDQSIASYDDLRTIINNMGGPIAIQECICRQSQEVLGNHCQKTKLKETCFSFRTGAKMYIEKGLAREISKDEALKILKQVEEDGLVLQPGNSQRPGNICTCCGCCCEVLNNAKRFPEPVELFATNYYAEVDADLCVGCGTCEERCNVDAIEIEDGISHVDRTRCIGCGVCIPTCPEEAIKLKKKETETVPPKNSLATYQAIMDRKAELARAEKS
jgi:ferredoxin